MLAARNPTPVDWSMLGTARADAMDGSRVRIAGWLHTLQPGAACDYGLLLADAGCCGNGHAADPRHAVEVFLRAPVDPGGRGLTLHGRWQCQPAREDGGWRYRLLDAELVSRDPVEETMSGGRRLFLAAGAAAGLVACAPGRFGAYADGEADGAAQGGWEPEGVAIDMHSHAGRVIVSRDPAVGSERPFLPVAQPMRAGRMHAICLAIVTDTTVTRVSADRQRFEAWRAPAPGELYALSQTEFARAAALIAREGLHVVTRVVDLRAAPANGPSVVIASEGADFLEGVPERVDEAWRLHHLRHLQLTHYRVNELGDIQTEPPVHGGLTDFGAEVVRRCNRLGIVVDVAHGSFDLVKRAAALTRKPLVLSHTSLAGHPGPRSRQITADHARAVAQTGGVIGVWPSSGVFKSLRAMADGVRRMADVVGVDHVGLGSDMLGFISPPVFRSYRQLPDYAAALQATGFSNEEVGKILGGNYLRVFETVLA